MQAVFFSKTLKAQKYCTYIFEGPSKNRLFFIAQWILCHA